MKFLLAMGLFGAIFAVGQPASTPPGTPGETKQNLIQIEQAIGRANMNCDYRFFERIEAEEFIFTDASGGVTTRKEDLAGEKDCKPSDASYDLDETEVRLYDNTAVVTSRVTIAGKNKAGQPFARRSRFTDVFVWRDGTWQLVAGHSSRIAEPKTP
jgi:ketosteroid isomerase-like protein